LKVDIKEEYKMNVKLISLTKSLIEEKELSAEELIVYCARVSNPENQMNTETSDKLLSYLIKNKHWSPMEMADMTIEIKTSRAIAAQILRHRSFSFQEFSQRYSEVSAFEEVQLRRKGATNRQSSEEEFDPIILDEFHNETGLGSDMVMNLIEHSIEVYNKLIEEGVAKECARMILPLTTQTTLYMKGSIRSWIHYLQIRCDEHTQLEHRQIALSILNIFKQNFPNIGKALNM